MTKKEFLKERIKSTLAKTLVTMLLLWFILLVCLSASPILRVLSLEDKQASANFGVQALIYYVIPPILYAQIQELDEKKRRRIALQYRDLRPSFPDSIRDAIHSVYFWLDALPFILLLTFTSSVHATVLYIVYPHTLPLLAAIPLKLLLYVLPMSISIISVEAGMRRDLHRLWKANLFRTEDGGDPILPRVPASRTFRNIAVSLILGFLLPVVLPVVNMLSAIIMASKPFFLPLSIIIILAVAWCVFRWFWWVYRQKRYFCKQLEEVCKNRGYSFRWITPLKEHLYDCSCTADFEVQTAKKHYVGTVIPVHGRDTSLYFWENPVYRFEKRFLTHYFFFPQHNVDLSSIREQYGEEVEIVVVLSRKPKTVYRGDEDYAKEISWGDPVHNFTLHCKESFVNWVDREHLFHEEKKY